MGNLNSFIGVVFTILMQETNKMCAQSKLPNEDQDPQCIVPQSKLVPDYGHEKQKKITQQADWQKQQLQSQNSQRTVDMKEITQQADWGRMAPQSNLYEEMEKKEKRKWQRSRNCMVWLTDWSLPLKAVFDTADRQTLGLVPTGSFAPKAQYAGVKSSQLCISCHRQCENRHGTKPANCLTLTMVFFQFYHKEQTNNSDDLLHVLMSQRMTQRGQKSQFCTSWRIMKHKTCTKSQCSTRQHAAFEMLTESRSEHLCHHLPPQTIIHSTVHSSSTLW